MSRTARGVLRRLVAGVRGVRHRPDGARTAGAPLASVLDLLEEHVYAGEITAEGRYVDHYSGPTFERLLGAAPPDRGSAGALWESRIVPDDWPAYETFNQALLRGEPGEVTYRLRGLDGVTRTLWDRARPQRSADRRTLVHGIISDVSRREAADARAADASARFTGLLDVVGEHVYLALVRDDGTLEELFQGPGADRLLGGAEPDPEMVNWEAAIHPDDRRAFEAFNAALAAGRAADVEYRLIGADGITRWVHDRAATRRREDGAIEISGIVCDVTERREMRAELSRTHAAVSRVVEALDEHLYTLRLDGCERLVSVYRGPHRARLAGGELPDGEAGDRVWASLVHPGDRARWEEALAELLAGRPVEFEYRVRGLDGVDRAVLDRLRARRDENGDLLFDGMVRDVTERRRLEAELRRTVADMEAAQRALEAERSAAEQRARTDELTGAYNRRHFGEVLVEALADPAAGHALLLLDADHFKHINDQRGHAIGDAVLIEAVRRVEAALAPGECLARWGGEEFAVLLRDVHAEAALSARAERIRAAVAVSPIPTAHGSVPLTVSIGAVRITAGSASIESVVELADRCLYVAKRDGRDRVSSVPHLALAS